MEILTEPLEEGHFEVLVLCSPKIIWIYWIYAIV